MDKYRFEKLIIKELSSKYDSILGYEEKTLLQKLCNIMFRKDTDRRLRESLILVLLKNTRNLDDVIIRYNKLEKEHLYLYKYVKQELDLILYD